MKYLIPILATLPSLAAAAPVKLDVSTGQPVLLQGQEQTTYLKIGLQGQQTAQVRTPVNLAIVLDRSSSMNGDRIVKAKEAALLVLQRLTADDIVSIITYDSTVEVLVPATKLTDREALEARIRAIEPRGSTALFAGVSKGLEEARKFLSNTRVNRVILLSDGQANVGPSSPNELARLGASAGKEGISITTLGLGLGYNEDLMAQLAEKSDGNHAFVADASDLTRIFTAELGDVMSVVAQEVTVKVKLNDGVTPLRVLNRDAQIYGDQVILSLNQIYAKQEKYFLLEVKLPKGKAGQTMPIAQVDVSYADVASGGVGRLTSQADVRYTHNVAEASQAENKPVMVAAVEAIAVQANRQAVALRDQGKVKEAEKALKDNAAYLKKNASQYKSSRLDTYGEQNQYEADNLDDGNWNNTRKAMRKSQHTLENQQSY